MSRFLGPCCWPCCCKTAPWWMQKKAIWGCPVSKMAQFPGSISPSCGHLNWEFCQWIWEVGQFFDKAKFIVGTRIFRSPLLRSSLMSIPFLSIQFPHFGQWNHLNFPSFSPQDFSVQSSYFHLVSTRFLQVKSGTLGSASGDRMGWGHPPQVTRCRPRGGTARPSRGACAWRPARWRALPLRPRAKAGMTWNGHFLNGIF